MKRITVDASSFKELKSNLEEKQRTSTELYRKTLEKDKIRMKKLSDIIGSQAREIAQLKNELSRTRLDYIKEKDKGETVIKRTSHNEHKKRIYEEANITKLIDLKMKDEKEELELIMHSDEEIPQPSSIKECELITSIENNDKIFPRKNFILNMQIGRAHV